jgi:Mg/Co/Ni transporter MgtE
MSDSVTAAVIVSVATIVAAIIAPWVDVSHLSPNQRLLREIILGAALGAIAGVLLFAIIVTFIGPPKRGQTEGFLLTCSLLGVVGGVIITVLLKIPER